MTQNRRESPPHILIVEGLSGGGSLLAAALEDEGYTCSVSANTRAGLEDAAQRAPALVVFSWRMAGMDGTEFFAALRAAGVTCPVLMCSAWSEAEDVAKVLDVPFLGKPFDLDVLYELVDGLIDG